MRNIFFDDSVKWWYRAWNANIFIYTRIISFIRKWGLNMKKTDMKKLGGLWDVKEPTKGEEVTQVFKK